MPGKPYSPSSFQLARRESSESDGSFDIEDADPRTMRPVGSAMSARGPLLQRIGYGLRRMVAQWRKRQEYRILDNGRRRDSNGPRSKRQRGSCVQIYVRRVIFWFRLGSVALLALIILNIIFNPSYHDLPEHYKVLAQRIAESEDYGRGNVNDEKIFIAASIKDPDGQLLKGEWGDNVLRLVDLLGNTNVYLSTYENSRGAAASSARLYFDKKVQCKKSIVHDFDFNMNAVPHVSLPDGFDTTNSGPERIKRIAYLAEVRNMALLPLDYPEVKNMGFDKVLILNDIMFDPVEAVQLLFSTNFNKEGRATYRAACAVDFVNPFKFYDTFATRDADGYSMGVPFFPWFSSSGNAISRGDVLKGKDAVRVKSCWGGMVAFDAKPFVAEPEPLRFRSEQDLFWESSECCLIHADIMQESVITENGDTAGIYMNPFVRVAYDKKTLKRLPYVKRLERLFSIPHWFVNRLAGLPYHNERRTETRGQEVEDKVWVSDPNAAYGGSYQMVTRMAKGDGFCGRRGLQLLRDNVQKGEKPWVTLPVPS